MSKLKLKNIANPIIYSLGITFSIYAAIFELHQFNNFRNFFLFSILILVILILELLISLSRKSNKVEINFDIHDEVNELWHIFYKLILPLFYYLSLVGFGYFNLRSSLLWIIIIFTFATYYLLFVNTIAFFKNIKAIESKTHYVYDLIKFLIFFTSTNTIVNLYKSGEVSIVIFAIPLFLIALTITIMMVQRLDKLNIVSTIYSIFSSLVIAAFFIAMSLIGNFNALQESVALTFLFYIFVAIIHHKLLKTLTISVISEYLVIIIVVLAVVYGIS
jgi:hypothetical protein